MGIDDSTATDSAAMETTIFDAYAIGMDKTLGYGTASPLVAQNSKSLVQRRGSSRIDPPSK